MTDTTREKFIRAATGIFSDKGFHGASIAAIADALGLTKQALLHHFGSKERLYGEVLERISNAIMEDLEGVRAASSDPVVQLEGFFIGFHRRAAQMAPQTRLLIRELLDNKQRAESAATWYLKPFLQSLTAMVQAVPRWQGRPAPEALACVYHLLGTINYFSISRPTLENMFGAADYTALEAAFEDQLRRLVRLSLDA